MIDDWPGIAYKNEQFFVALTQGIKGSLENFYLFFNVDLQLA